MGVRARVLVSLFARARVCFVHMCVFCVFVSE